MLRSRVAVISLSLTLAACTSESLSIDPVLSPASVPPELVASLSAGRWTSAVVRLDDRALGRELAAARSNPDRLAVLELRAQRVQALTDDLLTALPPGARATRVYQYLPLAVVELESLDAAFQLASLVRAMEPDRAHEASLGQSLDLIGQPAAAAAGFTGLGTAVAVLDTGADYTHADLGSCTAVGAPTTCRVAYAQDFASDDGLLDSSGHGTNVSAIVAGVAPEAEILALDVFSSDGYAYSSDILDALDWVVGNQSTYDIASVNMSLGAGSYSAPCADVFSAGIEAVRDAGVAVAIASGNNGYTDAIASPACNSDAISVGAVYDAAVGGVGWSVCTDLTTAADMVTCFSNSASFLDILAPGALITAGGYTLGGTSMAAPHVAGALAVVRAANPDVDVADLELMVLTTGLSVTDSRNSLTFPRLDLEAATASDLDDEDTLAPTGTVTIAGGAAVTATPSVTLALSGSDNSGVVSEMCHSASTDCSEWEPYATSAAWELDAGEGVQSVYAKFRDAALNESAQVSDTIVVDLTAPTDGSVSAMSGAASIDVSWSGFSDANGIATYQVVYGTTLPDSCDEGTLGYSGIATSVSLSGLTDGETYHIRVCATDAAGHRSAGATTSATLAVDSVPPDGTIVLNAGATWTNNKVLQVALSATDASEVTEMCVGASATCTTWVPYATSTTYTTTTTVGTKTVYAAFKDAHGNVSAAVSDTISYDGVVPKNGKMNTVTVGDQEVTLTWSGFSDVNSGIAEYKLVYQTSTAPVSCSKGTVGWTGAATTATITGLTNGTLYGFRVCAIDAAGNVSTGVQTTAKPASELDPPTGSVVAEGGAAYTTSRTIDLDITGSDVSGVTKMCLIIGTGKCTKWVNFATTTSVLASSDGTKTVNLYLEDSNGNQNKVAFSDSIVVDTVVPTNGTVTGTAGVAEVALTWSGFSDKTSGIDVYKVVYDTVSPVNCSAGTLAYTGSDLGATIGGLTAGTAYTFRVCAVDKAGLVSTGVTVVKTPL